MSKSSTASVDDSTMPPPASPPAVPVLLIDAIERMKRPVVVGHVVPDADALGSMFACAMALADGERRPTVALPDGSLSQRLVFMHEWAGVPVATEADFEQADGFIVVDTAKKSRCNVGPSLKDTPWSAGRPIVNIDHHSTNEEFGDVNWIVGDAGSTAELVYYLLRRMKRPMDAHCASLLYAGIQTDTLGFSLPSTNAAALLAAAELVAAGANVGELGERLGRSQRRSEFDLLKVIYANTRVACGGRLAYSFAGFDEIHQAGCSAADIDDQINVPRSLDGVELAMLFTEGERGKTRINFRGSGRVTVAELAARFKGGGHAQAAGAVVNAGLEAVIDQVVPEAIAHLEHFPGGETGSQGR